MPVAAAVFVKTARCAIAEIRSGVGGIQQNQQRSFVICMWMMGIGNRSLIWLHCRCLRPMEGLH